MNVISNRITYDLTENPEHTTQKVQEKTSKEKIRTTIDTEPILENYLTRPTDRYNLNTDDNMKKVELELYDDCETDNYRRLQSHTIMQHDFLI